MGAKASLTLPQPRAPVECDAREIADENMSLSFRLPPGESGPERMGQL